MSGDFPKIPKETNINLDVECTWIYNTLISRRYIHYNTIATICSCKQVVSFTWVISKYILHAHVVLYLTLPLIKLMKGTCSTHNRVLNITCSFKIGRFVPFIVTCNLCMTHQSNPVHIISIDIFHDHISQQYSFVVEMGKPSISAKNHTLHFPSRNMKNT